MAIFFILPLALAAATIAAVITIAVKPEKESREPLRWAIIDNEFIEYAEEAING